MLFMESLHPTAFQRNVCVLGGILFLPWLRLKSEQGHCAILLTQSDTFKLADKNNHVCNVLPRTKLSVVCNYLASSKVIQTL